MKILYCHNHYQQPGGEDKVADDEEALLSAKGHEVIRYRRHNDEIDGMGAARLLQATIWNRHTHSQVTSLIREHRPHIVHCANTFPLISPSAYAAARQMGVPVVQTLHNFRLICANAQLLRDGRVCEQCVGKSIGWPALRYGCYRGDRAATAAVAAMLATHRMKGTWADGVDRYIALTDFAKRKFVEGGLPAERIVVKPNFLPRDPGAGTGEGDFAIFVGRLSPEKGIETLLESWQGVSGNIELKIAGDGPLADRVQHAAGADRRIQWLGRLAPDDLLLLIGQARFLVMPSILYETFGLAMIEAFAKGTPVIASRHGAMAEIVAEGRTGLLFEPANAARLADTVNAALGDTERLLDMRRQARLEYEQKYTAEANYRQLLAVYEAAIGASNGSQTRPDR